jgi:hypothetical protein
MNNNVFEYLKRSCDDGVAVSREDGYYDCYTLSSDVEHHIRDYDDVVSDHYGVFTIVDCDDVNDAINSVQGGVL